MCARKHERREWNFIKTYENYIDIELRLMLEYPLHENSVTSSRPKGVRPSEGEPAAAKIPPEAAALTRAWVSDNIRRPS